MSEDIGYGCPRALEDIGAYLDGELVHELGPEGVREFERHVEECPACRARLEESRAMLASVRDAFGGGDIRAPKTLLAGVRAGLRPRGRLALPSKLATLAFAATVLLAATIGLGVLGTESAPREAAAPAREMAGGEIMLAEPMAAASAETAVAPPHARRTAATRPASEVEREDAEAAVFLDEVAAELPREARPMMMERARAQDAGQTEATAGAEAERRIVKSVSRARIEDEVLIEITVATAGHDLRDAALRFGREVVPAVKDLGVAMKGHAAGAGVDFTLKGSAFGLFAEIVGAFLGEIPPGFASSEGIEDGVPVQVTFRFILLE